MSDPLDFLKKELAQSGGKLGLLDTSDSATEDIKQATQLQLASSKLPLSEPTKFVVNEKPVTLKVIAYVWLNKDLSTAEFLEKAGADDVEILTFGQRNDLVQWLNGDSETSEYITEGDSQGRTDSSSTTTATTTAITTSDIAIDSSRAGSDVTKSSTVTFTSSAADQEDPFLKSVLSHERDLLNHNTSLRGSKVVDFANIAKECEIRIIKPLKRKQNATAVAAAADTKAKERDIKRQKQVSPIILISPASSAILNMTNLSAFLEHNKFIDPHNNNLSKEEKELLETTATTESMKRITHEFPKLGKITFRVENNAEAFTAAEHWDRVVAIVTTGQEWQFKSYKYTKPRDLFQHFKGYYFHYDKDRIPDNVNNWNVEMVPIDKFRRFKDAESLNLFWDSLERVLLMKGYK